MLIRAATSPGWLPLFALVACGVDAGGEHGPITAPLSEVFAVREAFVLEEDEEDPIPDIGVVLQTARGDLVIGDRLLPRVRRYTAEGRLVAAYGRYGEGPGELRSIRGLAEDEEGRIHVVDGVLNRITILGPDLVFEESWSPAVPLFGPVVAFADATIVGAMLGREGHLLRRIGPDGTEWTAFPVPDDLNKPYWRSVSRPGVANAGARLFSATSLFYPIEEITLEGETARVFGGPPPSFRPIPEVEAGAFATGTGGARFQDWLTSFTVIGRLFPIGDRHLAVVHATLGERPVPPFEQNDYAFDLYRIADGVKLYEDIELPTAGLSRAGRRMPPARAGVGAARGLDDPSAGWYNLAIILRG